VLVQAALLEEEAVLLVDSEVDAEVEALLDAAVEEAVLPQATRPRASVRARTTEISFFIFFHLGHLL